MKTSELKDLALDWAVAKCEGRDCYADKDGIWFRDSGTHPDGIETNYGGWTLCGPIIEREEIGIKRNAPSSIGREWEARPSITAKGAGGKWGYGPTPLLAAMRCYVASKLGDEVEIPEELK